MTPPQAPSVRLGFTDSREGVLAAIKRMGIMCCGYSHGDTWADRCDCKYGVADPSNKWPTLAEVGNGCPELRSLYGIIEAMADEEWAMLTSRAGGTPRGSLLRGDGIAARLHAADTAASMAQARIAEVRAALDLEGGVE